MKVPELEVDNITEDQNLEEQTDNIIQEGYKAVRETIEDEFEVEYESPHPSVAVFRVGNKAITVHYGDDYIEFTVDGRMAEEHEFVRQTSEEARQQLRKAIGVYSKLADAQLKYVSQNIFEKYT
jgi:hypothetical protein